MRDLSKILSPSLKKVAHRKDGDTLAAYSGDAWDASALPEIVFFPKDTKEVSAVARFAHDNKIPLTARGAGRGYVGGCVPVCGGIALSLEKLNRILEISESDYVAVVQPCVITGCLHDEAKKKKLYYPPDPASLKECSVGGNIATNAGGPRCLKYGVTRNYVLGLELVLADGTIVRTGGRTHKNKTGFNLTDLFVGSEGMLGIITEATLRLIPYPATRGAVVGTFSDASRAAHAVQVIFQSGLLPSALEVADAFTLGAARKFTKNVPQGDAFVLAEVGGSKNAVKDDADSIAKILKICGALEIHSAVGTKQTEKLWNMRRAFSYGLKATGLAKLNEDVTVPRGKLLELFEFAEKMRTKTGIQIACFGHAGDGNIHVNLMVPKEEKGAKKSVDALDRLFRQIVQWKGAITGEHGIGIAKKPWWKVAVSPELHDLHLLIKKSLDAHGILNPGKFLD